MRVLLAEPRGFCAGVERAIAIVEKTLEVYGPPIYVRHEIVHNRWVVDSLRRKGAIFVDELKDIPDHSTVIYSAHGVSKEVAAEGKHRPLRVLDATCPLVGKVHREAERLDREGFRVILIGHQGHPE
ncbi:MAG: 4-hydroxy-3-methylbut-2-enyl diphosphate reductase, partial [Magnetococcus sp. XQGC-1]